MKSEQEIDIIAVGEESLAIFCECKWTNEPVGASVLGGLVEKSKMFDYREKYYFLFSKSGYTKECEKSAGENVRLVDFGEMARNTRGASI